MRVTATKSVGLAARPLGPVHQTILGLIVEEPRHGYLIKKLLCEGNGRDFGINDGLLYPALGRLEREGLIRKEVVHQEKSPSKHTYHATRKGEEAFFRWLMDAAGEEDPFRYDFYLRFGFLVKATFFRHLDPRAVRRKVERQIAEAREKIRDFRRVRETMEVGEVDWYRLKIMDFGVGYQALKLQWLEQFARELDERIALPSSPRPRARKAEAAG
jgi:DNA-binding PadR family transcriptional regulator